MQMALGPGDLSAILAEQGMAPFFFVSLAHYFPKKEERQEKIGPWPCHCPIPDGGHLECL